MTNFELRLRGMNDDKLFLSNSSPQFDVKNRLLKPSLDTYDYAVVSEAHLDLKENKIIIVIINN